MRNALSYPSYTALIVLSALVVPARPFSTACGRLNPGTKRENVFRLYDNKFQYVSCPNHYQLGSFDFRSGSKLQLSSSSHDSDSGGNYKERLPVQFRRGNLLQVEVSRFGPLGASVEVIGQSHDEDDLIPQDEPPLAYGLILQEEIGYFRAARGGVDVVVGEILPAYVSWVRDDGKVDVILRKPGGKGKADDVAKDVMEKLKASENGKVDVGDKSSPHEINAEFPGASEACFKRAVASLYKKGLVKPGKYSTSLM
eukprot:CAMPEP_0197236178 /NCGR_PEP_ID=MMETSP1429-20130617/3386_1 /TAXON_ID=49237 /ORGANISM="Chaetoceros  sp., Strain UNC1202" /LENGTH=254 /DNA_ID=CAMNT_0042694927 /DNA_START=88 /DNA_END=852 /DNA_ORIENTATION=-